MAMLPQIARLPSGSSSRHRWSLALLGVTLLGLPTWYETAQSQETVPSQPAPGKTATSKEIGGNEATSRTASSAAILKAESSPKKNEHQERKIRAGGMGGGMGGMGGGSSASNSIAKKNLPVKTLAEPPTIEFHPQPSEAEQKILDQLNRPLTFDLKIKTLDEFFAKLDADFDINVIVDKEKLEEESVTTDAMENELTVRHISLRSAMKIILDRRNLGFYIEDEVVKVTTRTDILGRRLTRTYPVGDLISSYDDLESLADAIQQIVTPGDWTDDDDDSSQISMVPNMGTLIVRQTLPGHEEVLDLLRSLRKTKADTGLVKGMETGTGRGATSRRVNTNFGGGGGFF